MPANPNWVRWVFASVATYLKQVATGSNLPVLVEGLDERTPVFMQATDRAEVRVSGPFSKELSHGWYELVADANVLLTSRYDGQEKSRYAILQFAGEFQAAMQDSIPVYKYGKLPGDDGTLVGCLQLVNGRVGDSGGVRVSHFGQLDATNRLKQSIVDARYRMELQS
jgi:hypothetical protein